MPRVSIAALCVSIAIFAVDCVLLRIALFQRESLVSIRGVIFMMNVLALGLYRILLRRRQAQPFLVGFVVTGVLATLVYFDLCQWYYEPMLRTQNWIVAPFGMEVGHLNFVWIPRLGVGGRITERTTLISIAMAPLVTALIALPQLLLALAGGLLALRLAGSPTATVP